MKNIDDIYELLRQIPVTKANKPYIDEIEDLLTQQEYIKAFGKNETIKKMLLMMKQKMNLNWKLKNDEDEIYPEKIEWHTIRI